MNDTTETQSDRSGNIIRIHNKNLIFAALAEAGIHLVTVDYDGSGDSGQIDSTISDRSSSSTTPITS